MQLTGVILSYLVRNTLEKPTKPFSILDFSLSISLVSIDSLDPLLDRLFNDKPQRWVLPNGLTVIFKEDSSAEVVSVQAWVKTGSIHEGDMLGCGLSHFLEHMLFKGTERRSSTGISREVHALGGNINAYTTYDRTVYYIDCPSDGFEDALDVITDIVFHSRIPADEFSSERDVILREIDMGLDDPDRQLMYGLMGTAYHQHAYQYPVIGHRPLFESVTHGELERYYRGRYTPANTVLILVGAVDPEIAYAACMEKTEGIPQVRTLSPLVPQERPQLGPRFQELRGDVNLYRGGLAWKIPGLSHPDAPALDVLATLMGWGDSAILWKEIRDQLSLVSYIDASAWMPGNGGLFWIWYSGEMKDGDRAASAVRQVFEAFPRRTVNEADLEKARRKAIVGELNTRKTMSGQASRLGIGEVVVGDLEFSKTYFDRLAMVTQEDLHNLIPTYFQPVTETFVKLIENPAVGSKPPVAAKTGRRGAVPEFELVELENGAKILLDPSTRLPKVHLRTGFLGSSLYEPQDQRGITSLLATLLTKDTESKSAGQVAESIENWGGSFSDFCGNNSFGFGVETLSQDFSRAIGFLKGGLFEPAFHADTFETERESQIDEIEEAMDDIVGYGQFHLRQSFFQQHPYAYGRLGTVDTLKQLTPELVRQHFERLVVASNCVVAVSGDFDRDSVLDQLTELLSQLPRKAFNIMGGCFAGPEDSMHQELHLPREQAVVFDAYPDVGLKSDYALVAEVMDELFSGMSSRLFERVREEQGLAYYIGATRMVGLHTGMFTFYGGTHAEAVEQVYAEIDAEVKRVKDGGIEADELTRCQTRMKARKRMGLQTPNSRAMQAILNALYGLEINDWQSYPHRVDQVTVGDLQAFADSQFRENSKIRLTILPEE